MKKVLAVVLAMFMAFGCMSAVAAAADAAEAKVPAVGDILVPGDTIKAAFGANNCVVTYTVSADDLETTNSKLADAYAGDLGYTQFRDNISTMFNNEETYGGVYTVKGQGSAVDEMLILGEDSKLAWVTPFDIEGGPESFTIDFDYAKTTYYQYTTITGWKVTGVTDNAFSFAITLEAVYETREMTEKEATIEAIYAAVMKIVHAILDFFGNWMLEAVPAFLKDLADLMGRA